MSHGYSDVLIGLQFGDEGKARVIDLIAGDYDIIARFNGGPNAGHTIETEKHKIALHQIPSGVFYPDKILYIGSGCVLNPEKLVAEIKELEKVGVDLSDRLHISGQTSVIQPHHILIDKLTNKAIGTTENGIGPAYADRALRMNGNRLLNIKIEDFIHNNDFAIKKVRENLAETLRLLSGINYDIEESMRRFKESLTVVLPFVERDTLFVDKKVRNGARALFEGAQSFMLDVIKGTVPYVTSSHTAAGYAYVGGDLSPRYHRKTIGVAKAIMSRVGHGPFPSEYGGMASETYCMEGNGHTHDKAFEAELNVNELLRSDDFFDIGRALRILGNEYGATTGRPRRIGMLDLVQLNYAIRTNGVDELFLNKCDLLRDFSRTKLEGIPQVSAYRLENKVIDYVPGSSFEYGQVTPAVEFSPGFNETITEMKDMTDVPKSLTNLLNQIEHHISCPITGMGVGPKREEYVKINPSKEISRTAGD
ncbi:Adenylosuccinate synthetase [Candidatus Norongarragalina meridionalis]|nr:Adenylosuccinate synthetase [Candidatus Norongarragalina meridionalis]